MKLSAWACRRLALNRSVPQGSGSRSLDQKPRGQRGWLTALHVPRTASTMSTQTAHTPDNLTVSSAGLHEDITELIPPINHLPPAHSLSGSEVDEVDELDASSVIEQETEQPNDSGVTHSNAEEAGSGPGPDANAGSAQPEPSGWYEHVINENGERCEYLSGVLLIICVADPGIFQNRPRY